MKSLNISPHEYIDQAAEKRKKDNNQRPDKLPSNILGFEGHTDEASDLNEHTDGADDQQGKKKDHMQHSITTLAEKLFRRPKGRWSL